MKKQNRDVATRAHLKCPECLTVHEVEMPLDFCQFFFECSGCGALLKPKPGDCCVFCFYADVPCPPKQAKEQRKVS